MECPSGKPGIFGATPHSVLSLFGQSRVSYTTFLSVEVPGRCLKVGGVVSPVVRCFESRHWDGWSWLNDPSVSHSDDRRCLGSTTRCQDDDRSDGDLGRQGPRQKGLTSRAVTQILVQSPHTFTLLRGRTPCLLGCRRVNYVSIIVIVLIVWKWLKIYEWGHINLYSTQGFMSIFRTQKDLEKEL